MDRSSDGVGGRRGVLAASALAGAGEGRDPGPELVRLDALGRPRSVKYDALPVLLLAEVQRLRAMVDAQASALAAEREVLDALRSRLEAAGSSLTP